MAELLVINEDDLSSEQTRALLALHVAGMEADSPPGTCFVLDLSGLQSSDVTVWSAWYGDAIAGIGALKALGDGTGEVKSMRTHPDHVGKGVGRAVLDRIIEEARARGLRRLSLETGDGPAFEAALALYRRRGFIEGEAFGDYPSCGGFDRYFHLEL